MPEWVVIAVDVPDIFPIPEESTTFRGREFILRAGDKSLYPDISLLRAPSESYGEAATLVHRFLSALCWTNQIKLITVGHNGGTERTRIGGRPSKVPNPVISSRPRPGVRIATHHLPESLNPEAQLALAIYREALGLECAPYQFLGFFKIINIRYAGGPQQIDWINRAIAHLTYPASERIRAIQQSHPDVGNYLFVQGRCAVAHANTPPTADPDLFDHMVQFNQDLLIVKELAEHFIRSELGVT